VLSGAGVIAGSAADHAQGAEGGDQFDVVGAERFLLDRQGTAKALFGQLEIASARVDRAKISERHRDLVMVGTERALEDSQRTLEHFGRLVVASGGVENGGQRGAISGSVRMVGAKAGLPDRDGIASRSLSLGGASRGVGEAADVVEHGRDFRVVGAQLRLEHGTRTLIELSGFFKRARVLEQDAEVIADSRGSEVVSRQVAFRARQRPAIEPFGTT
jgi:hypothetical protein